MSSLDVVLQFVDGYESTGENTIIHNEEKERKDEKVKIRKFVQEW